MKRVIFSCFCVLFLALASARADHCYDLVLVPGSNTLSVGSTTCTVTILGWKIGIPTPWGLAGWDVGDTVYSTSCRDMYTIVPATYTLKEGDNLVEETMAEGTVKTFTGCSLNSDEDGAQCNYETTTTQHPSWKLAGLCISPL